SVGASPNTFRLATSMSRIGPGLVRPDAGRVTANATTFPSEETAFVAHASAQPPPARDGRPLGHGVRVAVRVRVCRSIQVIVSPPPVKIRCRPSGEKARPGASGTFASVG